MTATPVILGDKYQKAVVILQNSNGTDYDSSNPIPVVLAP